MLKNLTTTSLLLVLAGAALAQDLPDGIGVLTPSGSSFTTEITANDSDDYVFQGYPGMSLTATVKLAKGSTLVPVVEVLRPGGEALDDTSGIGVSTTSKGVTAKVVLDSTGWWKVRVRGANGSIGAYTVTIKYTAPKLAPLPVKSKGFKASAAISDTTDSDLHEFDGQDGQSISLTLTMPKGSGLDPLVQLLRPDGTVADAVGLGTVETSLRLSRDLDATGRWAIKVAGEEADPAPPRDDGTTGPYSLVVKLGKVAAPSLVPDGNDQYRFTLPGIAGASISYKITAKNGPAPTFNSIRGPDGKPVAGFPGGLAPKPFRLLPVHGFGDYTVTFDAADGAQPQVTVKRTLSLPKGEKKRKARLDKGEPVILTTGVSPTEGGPGTLLTVTGTSVIDPESPTDPPTVMLGHLELEEVTLLPDRVSVRGRVPASLPEGTFDVVLMSSSGQPAARAGGFRRVPPPTVSDIDPTVGTSAGNYPLTISGGNFRPGRMGILLEGNLQPITPSATTETSVTFNAPPRAPGLVAFGVVDLDTQLGASLDQRQLFEYVATAAISRIVPSVVPTLGGEVITVQGAQFSDQDTVYLETTTPGQYETMVSTFINSKAHQFTAPPRPKGVYRVHVQDSQGQPNPPKTRNLTYYSFADITATTNLGTLGADKYDGWTTAIADFDQDGDQDLFVSRRGNPADTAPGAASLTRVLRQDEGAQFADVTAASMPATDADDWRADRIWATDVTQDGYPDLVLTTNAVDVPEAGKSHTRILVNEAKGGSSAERVFRDRTSDLMALPRRMQKYGVFGGDASFYVSDDWRGLDMWVGDIDKGGPSPPEILITHEEVKDDDNPHSDVFSSGVYCGNYCSSSGSYFAYSYTFYWGGSRLFVWDKSARAGQGRYKFDPNFFPRSSGPVVPQGGVPGGGTILPCSPHYNRICKATFTPFTGKRLAVGNLDTDGRPDVAVASDQSIQRRAEPNDPLNPTSSLQVGINRFNSAEGSGVTDMTGKIYAIGGDTKGDAVAIGQPGYPDGNSFGVIALAKAASIGTSSVLRLLKFKPDTGVGDFEDISAAALPAADSADQFQASALEWIDVDQDGDQDLVLVAPTVLAPSRSSFRVFRNERVGVNVGLLRRTLDPLVDAMVGAEHFEAQVMTIGDITGDGLLDFLLTRAVPSGGGAQTRIVRTDK